MAANHEVYTHFAHKTHVRFEEDLELQRCSKEGCHCGKVHCPFCNIHCFKPSRPARVRDHLNQTHFKHGVLHKELGVLMVKCYHECDTSPGHFHCPYCSKELMKKAGFLYHLQSHLKKMKKPLSLVQAPNYRQPKRILFDGILIELCSQQCPGCLSKHYHCPLCKEKSFEGIGQLSDHLWRCREQAKCGEELAATSSPTRHSEANWTANIEINTHAVAPKERFGENCHISIVRNMGDLPLSRCDHDHCCHKRYHCALCPRTKFKPNFRSHMQEHYLTHWNNRVSFGGYSSVVCYLHCQPQGGQPQYHFHCPKCGATRRRKSQFKAHLSDCLEPGLKEGMSLDQQEKNSANSLQSNSDIHEKLPTSTQAEDHLLTDGDDVTDESTVPVSEMNYNKVLQVYETVSAQLSSEFLSCLQPEYRVHELLRSVCEEVGVELLYAPGVHDNSVYTLSGTVEGISAARQLLTKKLPENIQQLAACTKYAGNEEQDAEISSAIDVSEILDATSTEIADVGRQLAVARVSNGQTYVSIKSEITEEDPQETYSDDLFVKKMDYLKTGKQRCIAAINAMSNHKPQNASLAPLEMLTSVANLMRDNSETKDADKVTGSSTKRQKLFPMKDFPQKDTKATAPDQGRSKRVKSEMKLMPQNNDTTPERRYSTRGTKLDFSLLATGKKKKEDSIEPRTSGSKVQEDTEAYADGKRRRKKTNSVMPSKSTESKTAIFADGRILSTSDDLDFNDPDIPLDIEEEDWKTPGQGKKRKELRGSHNDSDDHKVLSDMKDEHCKTSGQHKNLTGDSVEDDFEAESKQNPKKLIFSSMAVIPLVTFDMQTLRMSQMLTKHALTSELSGENETCPLCECITPSFASLVQHCFAEHNLRVELHCSVCKNISLDDDMKHEHLKICPDVKKKATLADSNTHQCLACSFKASDFCDVTNHVILNHNGMFLRCDVCEVQLKAGQSMEMHLQRHGPRPPPRRRDEKRLTKCNQCSFNNNSFRELTDHLISVHGLMNQNRCDVCEMVFDDMSQIQQHLSRIHGPFEEHLVQLQCPDCGCLCKNKSALSRHRSHVHRIKIGKETTNFKINLECKTCYFVAKDREELVQHRTKHKQGIFRCDECNLSFKSVANIQFHMQLHHKATFGDTCKICGKTFKHHRYMKSHMKRHTGEKKYKCDECGKCFLERRSLLVHMDIHKPPAERTYRYICSYCGRGYNSHSNFSDHVNMHTGEKPFQCDKCDKRFSFRSQLAQHKIYIHSTERPFRCLQCDKSFKLRGKLQQHQLTHSSVVVSRYCHQCDQTFSSNSSLKTHQQSCGSNQSTTEVQRILLDNSSEVELMIVDGYPNYVSSNEQETMEKIQAADDEEDQPIFVCGTCGVVFQERADAELHINTAHENGDLDDADAGMAEEIQVVLEEQHASVDVTQDNVQEALSVIHVDQQQHHSGSMLYLCDVIEN